MFIIIILFIVCLPGLVPIKFAVKESELTDKKEYILVEETRVTGFYWVIVGDQTGYYYPLQDDKRRPGDFIKLTGKIPVEGYRQDPVFGDSTYVCYGKYTGTDTVYEGTNIYCGQEYKIYEVDDWDILYPIGRYSPINVFTPKYYLTLYDRWGF